MFTRLRLFFTILYRYRRILPIMSLTAAQLAQVQTLLDTAKQTAVTSANAAGALATAQASLAGLQTAATDAATADTAADAALVAFIENPS